MAVSELYDFKIIHHEVSQQGKGNIKDTGDSKAIPDHCSVYRFTRIGGNWDRKGETEIDLIAINELENYAEFIEVKCNATEINLEKLREKSFAFMRATGELKDYRISYRGLSMKDM